MSIIFQKFTIKTLKAVLLCGRIKEKNGDVMRKFLRYFNIFELDLTVKSYKSPAIRIASSILAMLVVCLLRFNVTIKNPTLNILISLLVLVILIMSILCLFIASVECLQVGQNKKIAKARENDKYK